MPVLKKILVVLILLAFFPSSALCAEKIVDRANIKAALLVDMESGKVLYSYNERRVIQPASLTKILTLYLVNEEIRAGNIKDTDKVRISARAAQTNGSKIFYDEGDWAVFGDLVKFMAIFSANDASIAVAEHLAGTVEDFVARMNNKAKELGMKNSNFVNPHGLPDPRQKITANDIYLLSRSYLERFPDALKIHSLPSFQYNYVEYPNRNTLLQENSDVDGLKTGYVRAAGYHLVATAKRGEKRLLAIVLGAKNPQIRDEQTKALLEYGFKNEETRNPDPMVGA
ncbi:MAG TPA: D-alanyl-D-alanine carboxypeptidase family protein [Smithellaceae bacterium]|nr:D-alanyl-D-alanine carboxypeptidase family protein [Smithellaceae bacterium]HRS88945.1 D-alanyl-D-alanine carboxypeptidase family protein [Smithellaceae bacterium]HRV25561.1 D-alanyl-D-alanine carboxypeptidase family protein [Smithellaceae bacterium]